MKLSLDFVRTLPKNDAKTEFSSSLSTNLTDRFWTWVISGLTRFKLDFRPIYRRSSYKGQKWIKSGRSKVFQTDHTERTDVCQKDHPDCNLMTVHFLIYLVPGSCTCKLHFLSLTVYFELAHIYLHHTCMSKVFVKLNRNQETSRKCSRILAFQECTGYDILRKCTGNRSEH